MAKNMKVPKGMPAYSDLINPTVKALQELGGSGQVDEIYNEVLINLALPDEISEFPHSGRSNQTELQYRLAWARTYLKKYGIIENTSRGVWVILPQHRNIESIDVEDCIAKVQNMSVSSPKNTKQEKESYPENKGLELPDEVKPWRAKLYDILHSMDPYAFERLTQRLLRECGFSQVEVTKKSGDGGIDGFGRFMINGIFSFKVAFQCKRYKGSVPVSNIRDFRGSLTTDIEKALFITTGSFPKSVRDEAVTPGKIQIDLIDGEDFIDRLAAYKIGVKPVIDYEVDEEFFSQI